MYIRKKVGSTFALALVFLLLAFQMPLYAVPTLDAGEVKKRKILIHQSLLKIYTAQNRVEEALKEFPIVIALLPQDARLHYDFGVYLMNSGRSELSLKQLKRAVELAPANADYNGTLGTVLIRLNRYQEGLKYLRDAIRYGGTKYEKTYRDAQKYMDYVKKMEEYKKKQKEYRNAQEKRRQAAEEAEEQDDDW